MSRIATIHISMRNITRDHPFTCIIHYKNSHSYTHQIKSANDTKPTYETNKLKKQTKTLRKCSHPPLITRKTDRKHALLFQTPTWHWSRGYEERALSHCSRGPLCNPGERVSRRGSLGRRRLGRGRAAEDTVLTRCIQYILDVCTVHIHSKDIRCIYSIHIQFRYGADIHCS